MQHAAGSGEASRLAEALAERTQELEDARRELQRAQERAESDTSVLRERLAAFEDGLDQTTSLQHERDALQQHAEALQEQLAATEQTVGLCAMRPATTHSPCSTWRHSLPHDWRVRAPKTSGTLQQSASAR